MKILSLILTLLLAAPAAADCVTASTLATGITFTRENHRSGLAVADGQTIRIDYANGTVWTDRRVTRLGIYDLSAEFHFNDLPTVGGGSPSYTWNFPSKPPIPSPGHTFRARITQTRAEDIGTRVTPPPITTTLDVTYTYLAAQSVTLSRCPYTVIPVEAAFSDHTTQRWIYFPDLGLGLETRPRGIERQSTARLGLLSLQPAS